MRLDQFKWYRSIYRPTERIVAPESTLINGFLSAAYFLR